MQMLLTISDKQLPIAKSSFCWKNFLSTWTILEENQLLRGVFIKKPLGITP
jgi:hypothetical protein